MFPDEGRGKKLTEEINSGSSDPSALLFRLMSKALYGLLEFDARPYLWGAPPREMTY